MLIMMGVLSGCIQSNDKKLNQVETLLKSGQWDKGEQLLTSISQTQSTRYIDLETSISRKKEADKHYEAKRYAEAFIQYDQMLIKDELVVKRSKNLAQYRVEDLKKKIIKAQQSGFCQDVESAIFKINLISISHPNIKYSPSNLEQQRSNCFLQAKAMDAVKIGDYNEALSYFEKIENYSTHAVVLYILALQSEMLGYPSSMESFLYRIPADYNGPYYEKILTYKKKYIPKSQWKKQYNKYHKLAFSSYEEAMIANSIPNKGRSNSGYRIDSKNTHNKNSSRSSGSGSSYKGSSRSTGKSSYRSSSRSSRSSYSRSGSYRSSGGSYSRSSGGSSRGGRR
ncbi:hypothetical protein NQ117_21915 [Paenibacillus sp. SC116]|nr:hypothetical protein [Paenibacillus sp. SC116]